MRIPLFNQQRLNTLLYKPLSACYTVRILPDSADERDFLQPQPPRGNGLIIALPARFRKQ